MRYSIFVDVVCCVNEGVRVWWGKVAQGKLGSFFFVMWGLVVPSLPNNGSLSNARHIPNTTLQY